MAYQKLQVSSSLDIIPSDTVDIPNPSSEVVISQGEILVTSSTGVAPSLKPLGLFDVTQTFIATGVVSVGDRVINQVSLDTATIVSIDSDFLLTLSAAIMPLHPAAAEAYIILRADNRDEIANGTAIQDTTPTNTLVDSGQTFITTGLVAVGDVVTNTVTGNKAVITVIDTDTLLTLSTTIMPDPADPAEAYIITTVLPSITTGAFNVAGTLTLVAGALASEAGILPGAIVYNTGAAQAYTVVEVVDNDTITITPSSAGGATDAFVIYNEATDAAVLYSGGPLQDIKTTMASNSVDVFKNIPQGAYLPIQVKRVWDNSDTPQDVIALW